MLRPCSAPSYGRLLQDCIRRKALGQGKLLHAHLVASAPLLPKTLILATILVDMYAKCGGSLAQARKVFDGVVGKDVLLWTVMTSAYVARGWGQEALLLFGRMEQNGMKPDRFAFAALLNACTALRDAAQGRRLHACIVNAGLGLGSDNEDDDDYVASALVDMYVKCGGVCDARRVLDGGGGGGVAAWNALVAGYARSSRAGDAVAALECMQRVGVLPDRVTLVAALSACAAAAPGYGRRVHALTVDNGFGFDDPPIASALVSMYAKCGSLTNTCRAFERTRCHHQPDVVEWSTMISAYNHHGQSGDALTLFEQMQEEGTKPDCIALAAAATACASLSSLGQAKQLHACAHRCGLVADAALASALVDMYAKCGSIDSARRVFDGRACQRDTISWGAMIGGYAQHGRGKEALALFARMQCEGGIEPDASTFVSVLSACSHEGLVDEARCIFNRMTQEHSITLTVEHYNCMVDLLGRFGYLSEAENLIRKMPIKPTACVWKALLGACRVHGETEIGERAL